MASSSLPPVIDLTLDDSEEETPSEDRSSAKWKKRRLPWSQGPSNDGSKRPPIKPLVKPEDSENETSTENLSSTKWKKKQSPLGQEPPNDGSKDSPNKALVNPYGPSQNYGGDSHAATRVAASQHPTADQSIPGNPLPMTKRKDISDASNVSALNTLKVEEPVHQPITPQTPKAKNVSPSRQKAGLTPASASSRDIRTWLDKSPISASQKAKTSKKLKMPKPREKTEGMKPLVRNAVFEFGEVQQDRTLDTHKANKDPEKTAAISGKATTNGQDVTARPEKAITGIGHVRETLTASPPKHHQPESDVIHVASEIQRTQYPLPSSTNDPLTASAVAFTPSTAKAEEAKHADAQESFGAGTRPAIESPAMYVKNIEAHAATTSVPQAQTGITFPPLVQATNPEMEAADEDLDVIRYLDRVNIPWYRKINKSKAVIVLMQHLAAIRSGLLGNVLGEKFSLNVDSQGELLVKRKDITNSEPSQLQEFAPDKRHHMFDPSPLGQGAAANLASSQPIRQTTKSPVLGPWSSSAPKPATSNSKKHEKRLKRNFELLNSNQMMQLADEYVWSGSEIHDNSYNSDYPMVDSAGESYRRISKRKFVRSPSPLHSQTHSDSHATTPTVQTGWLNQELSKTRLSGYPTYTRGSLLRNRDIGGPGHLNTQQALARLRESCLDTTIWPWKSWTGASKDIINVAWAPDGLAFVAGSSTDLDERNLQYNRSNNLLWCDITKGTMLELDDHKINHPGLNIMALLAETAELNTVLDSDIFTTISDICYGRDATEFWTASYDQSVKLWNVEDMSPRCVKTFRSRHHVDILARCEASSAEVIAMAQKSPTRSIRMWQSDSGRIPNVAQSNQAERYDLVPTALTWGNLRTGTGKLLAAGYGERGLETLQRSRGDIVLWDAEAERTLVDLTSRLSYVYDLRWHPQERWIAAAAPVKEKPHAGLRGTKSNIRIWEPYARGRCIFNLDCLALDINSIVFNPIDSMLVSVACTDGKVYHYDLRQPLQILATLDHGDSIMPLDPDRSPESQDPGVQFLSWNAAGTLLYSGSSDGKIKQWNPALNAENVFIQDIATLDAGISSGAFSPDFTNLLIGTNKGSAHVFSSAPVTPWVDTDGDDNEATMFNYLPARRQTGRSSQDE